MLSDVATNAKKTSVNGTMGTRQQKTLLMALLGDSLIITARVLSSTLQDIFRSFAGLSLVEVFGFSYLSSTLLNVAALLLRNFSPRHGRAIFYCWSVSVAT